MNTTGLVNIIALLLIGAYVIWKVIPKASIKKQEEVFTPRDQVAQIVSDLNEKKRNEPTKPIESIPAKANQLIEWSIPNEYEKRLLFVNGISVAQKNGKQGLIDKNNQILVAFKFDEIGLDINGIRKVKIGEEYGFINNDGEIVIPVEYQKLDYKLRMDIFSAQKDNKYGVLSKKGEQLVPFVISEFEDYNFGFFSSDYRLFKNGDKYGVLSLSDPEIILDAEYESIKMHKGDIFLLLKEGKNLIYSKSEKQIYDFSEYSKVSLTSINDYLVVEKNGETGLVNKEKKIVFPFADQTIDLKTWEDYFFVIKDDKSSIIDSSLQVLVTCDYSIVSYLPKCKLVKVKSETNKLGLISLNNEIALPLEYNEITSRDIFQSLPEGLLLLKDENKTISYLNIRTNQKITAPEGTKLIRCLGNDLFVVEKNNQKGVMDETGAIKVPFKYVNISKSSLSHRPHLKCYINNSKESGGDGTTILVGLNLKDFTEVFRRVGNEKLDPQGKEWIEYPNSQGYFHNYLELKLIKTEKKIGINDKYDQEIVPAVCEDYSVLSDAFISLKKDGKWGCIDMSSHLAKLRANPKYLGTPFPPDFVKKITNDFPEQEHELVKSIILKSCFFGTKFGGQEVSWYEKSPFESLNLNGQMMRSLIEIADGDLDVLLGSMIYAHSREIILDAQNKTGRMMNEAFVFP